MNDFKSLIAYPLFTAFIVFLSSSIWFNYQSSSGEISIGSGVAVEKTFIKSVSIGNTSNNFIDGLVLTLPSHVKIEDIHSSAIIAVEDVTPKNVTHGHIFRIDKIPPSRRIEIFIASTGTADYSITSNAKSIGFDVVNEGSNRGNVILLLAFAGSSAVISFLSSLAISMVEHRNFKARYSIVIEERNNIKTSMDSLLAMNNDLKITQEELREEMWQSKKRAARIRHLQSSKLNEYSRELNFWRDLVSYCVRSKFTGQEISLAVSKKLKTYATLHTLKKPDRHSENSEEFDVHKFVEGSDD